MSSSRADRLEAILDARDLDALVVTNLTNIFYLTGFSGTNGVCVTGKQARLFFTDFRYVEQARGEVGAFDVVQGKQDLLGDVATHLSGRVGFDDAHLSVRQHERLSGLINSNTELVPAGGAVEELRAVKEPDELEAIRQAAKLADDVYGYVCERGLVGRSEREVALDLELKARELGAEGPSFPSIVAAGAHAALPHARPRDEVIAQNELVIVDFGCIVDGYCSDATRTFATGSLDEEAAAVYELVLGAQTNTLEAVHADTNVRAVDAVARNRIDQAGYGEFFGHGVGHGVGLEVHEGPRLAPTSEDRLASQNVITIEPGVYLPAKLGVRIEDLVVVTPTGYEVLSSFPKGITTLSS